MIIRIFEWWAADIVMLAEQKYFLMSHLCYPAQPAADITTGLCM